LDLEVTFPGGRRVEAHYGGFTIAADKAVEDAGQGSAPTPFDLFLASLGTCAGMNLVYSFEHRGLSPRGARLVMKMEEDAESRMVTKITTEIHLPPDFPNQHKERLLRAVDACYVKKHVLQPPQFETKLVEG